MSSGIEWIKTALARDPAKTRAGMAEALGVDRSAVTRLLSGERQLKFHEAEKIAAYLGVASPIGLAEKSREFGGGLAEPYTPEVAPIYAASALKGGRWSLSRHHEPVDWRPRAPHFLNAAKVFGFYAPDDTMAPRFLAGEIVWVDPVRPVAAGDDALFVEKRRGAAGPETVILAAFTGLDSSAFEAVQHLGRKMLRLERRQWSALHVLPRY